MPLLSRTVSVIATSSGRQLALNIPAAFAEEMGIAKGDKVKVEYDPDAKRLIVSGSSDSFRPSS